MKVDPFVRFEEYADGSGDLFSPERCRPVRLNRSGVVLWKAFASGKDSREAAESLAARFPGVPGERLLSDAESFKKKLTEAGLLVSDAPVSKKGA